MVWQVRSIPTGECGFPLLLLWLSVDSNSSAAFRGVLNHPVSQLVGLQGDFVCVRR